ncbi:PrsW family glutamic-type intramembrane protease [Lignipirellula cremea]|uniref:FHA domain protein n=1 Tax=Lignipirellula cremea TaxID=2528010 RepID=A0A518DPV3_9BACT|nr:PrsW family glutamic-type intramembrane protease [Lignipirellula cremea]QDU93866.1 FHA domain protein [Lignipirellula cremea]
MSQWSMPIRAGWKLRVVTGASKGKEYDLKTGRYLLGSSPQSTICIPDPSIASQHVELDVQADHVQVVDRSGAFQAVLVNGRPQSHYRAAPGDEVRIGVFAFQLINAGVVAAQPPTAAPDWFEGHVDNWSGRLRQLAPHWQVALVTGTLASLLLLMMVLTSNTKLAPISVLAASLVAPATLLTWLIDKYDKTGISLRTLAITFLLGGAIGFVATLVSAMFIGLLLGGLLLAPVFAGVFEEPAKLLATAWRWRHPAYDRPMDGLILGAASGFGFAVFETAGYFLETMLEDGVGVGIWVVVIRSLCSPFGHGLWTAIVCAAFWQSGRKLKTAVKDRRFQIAFGTAVGLHALWNLGASIGFLGLGLPFCIGSAYLSYQQFFKRLNNNGYM